MSALNSELVHTLQMLEENAKMIQAVVENQNLNKMDECLQ